MIRVQLASIFVDDQAKALEFYTNILGFEKKEDEPVGEHKWISVGQADEDFELVLEPDAHPAAKAFKDAIYKAGIPATMLFVDDIDNEYNRLKAKGVAFKSAPTAMGKVKAAIFDDTCGNLIMLCQNLARD